jgi:peptidoglycan-N-acetylglucosamine deacetylase
MGWTDPSGFRHLFPWALWRAPSAGVCLTFDDGPDPEWTPRVLDLLGREGTPAAFFLTGHRIRGRAALLARMASEGHTVANHGYSHRSMAFRRSGWIQDEIGKTDAEIHSILGRKTEFFRPPYGRFDPRFRRMMRRNGSTLVLWSLMPGDFQEIDRNTLVERVRTRLHPGAVIVLHDGHRRSSVMTAALPGILAAVRGAGLEFAPLPRAWSAAAQAPEAPIIPSPPEPEP